MTRGYCTRVISVLRWLFDRNTAERDLHDELETFIDMSAADRIGMVCRQPMRPSARRLCLR
jgi:hypothetical protein